MAPLPLAYVELWQPAVNLYSDRRRRFYCDKKNTRAAADDVATRRLCDYELRFRHPRPWPQNHTASHLVTLLISLLLVLWTGRQTL